MSIITINKSECLILIGFGENVGEMVGKNVGFSDVGFLEGSFVEGCFVGVQKRFNLRRWGYKTRNKKY